MDPETVSTLVTILRPYDPLVEIGIGRRTVVARALADRGNAVTAIDRRHRPVPDGVAFVRDDVTDPQWDGYQRVEALYALNLPPELHRPVYDLARTVDATLLFTTLGTDPPTIPCDPQPIPGDTVYLADRTAPGAWNTTAP